MLNFRIVLLAFVTALSVVMGSTTAGAAPEIDLSFGDHGIATLGESHTALTRRKQIAVRKDGSFVVAYAVPVDDTLDTRWLIKSFTKNGKVDRRFSRDGQITVTFPHESQLLHESIGQAAAFDSRGRLVVAGIVDHVTPEDFRQAGHENWSPYDITRPWLGVIRLTRSGHLDNGFGRRGITQIKPFPGSNECGQGRLLAHDIRIFKNDSIVVGGPGNDCGEAGRARLYRLSSRGRLTSQRVLPRSTSTFGEVRLDRTGRVYWVGVALAPNRAQDHVWIVERLNLSGFHDHAFGHAGKVHITTNLSDLDRRYANASINPMMFDVNFDKTGQIFFASTTADKDGRPRMAVAKISKSGRLSRHFGTRGIAMAGTPEMAASSGTSVNVLADGSVYVGGQADPAPYTKDSDPDGWQPRGIVSRFSPSGAPLRKWATQGTTLLTRFGLKSCFSGVLTAVSDETPLAIGCATSLKWDEMKPSAVRLTK